jgi:hypothetical protein
MISRQLPVSISDSKRELVGVAPLLLKTIDNMKYVAKKKQLRIYCL